MNQQQHNQCGKQIHQIMQKQIDLISEYIDYLDSIKLAVTANDSQKLDDLLTSQQLSPELIEQTQQQQAKVLVDFGYESSDNGLNTCFQNCDNYEQLFATKKLLKERLELFEKSLLVNALLVRKNQDRVRQSVRILSGHNASSNTSSTYSRQGNTDTEESSHTIAQA